jgi:diguanylate cyclase (GGDEF)-like protein
MDVYLADNSTQPMITTLRFRHKNGDIVWALSRRKGILNHQGKVVRVIGTITNITGLKEHENFLKQMAYNDFLTKACNKPAFIDATEHAIARAKRNQQQVAVIFVDLDDFKSINDTWGHHFGDEVLCRVAQILTSFLRVSDLLARMGGDEFAILLEDITNPEELRAVAARVISAFTEPLLIETIKLPVTISMGLALYPVHGKTERAILKYADHNMYLAKQQGKNQFVL